jgi:hypothetical protein
MKTSIILKALVIVALAGCSVGRYAFVPTTSASQPPRERGCAIDLLMARPSRPFVEVGMVESTGLRTASAAEFLDKSREAVCRAGGDAVLAEINHLGYYVRGAVLKYQSDAAVVPTPSTAERR